LDDQIEPATPASAVDALLLWCSGGADDPAAAFECCLASISARRPCSQEIARFRN
jgi:hypothetical protein